MLRRLCRTKKSVLFVNSPEPFSVAAGLFALFSFTSLAALHKNFDFFEKSSCFFRKNMIHCYRFPETEILHRGVAQLVEQRSPKPRVQSSSLCSPAMLCGQNRSARENKRKREISRDFSRFFDPEFFRKNTDPFCDFFRPQGSEPAKTGFSKKSETELNSRKDLNPRYGSNPFGFFVVFTECLQISDYKINPSELGEDLNPRGAQKQKLQNNSISPPVGFELTKPQDLIVISLFSGLSAFDVVIKSSK